MFDSPEARDLTMGRAYPVSHGTTPHALAHVPEFSDDRPRSAVRVDRTFWVAEDVSEYKGPPRYLAMDRGGVYLIQDIDKAARFADRDACFAGIGYMDRYGSGVPEACARDGKRLDGRDRGYWHLVPVEHGWA